MQVLAVPSRWAKRELISFWLVIKESLPAAGFCQKQPQLSIRARSLQVNRINRGMLHYSEDVLVGKMGWVQVSH